MTGYFCYTIVLCGLCFLDEIRLINGSTMEVLNLIFGDPTNIKLEDDPGYELADAAIRALRRAGKWTPAKDADGKDLYYRTTYKFTLSIKEFRTRIF